MGLVDRARYAAGMHFSVEKIDEVLSVTAFHNVVAFMLTAAPRREQLQHVSRVMEDALAAYPHGIATVSLLSEGVTAPSIDLRSEISAMIERFAGRLLLGISIIDDRGIFAAARRAFMRGMLLLLRRSRVVIATSIEDAARHLSAVAVQADGTPVPQAELLALLRSCQRHLEEIAAKRG